MNADLPPELEAHLKQLVNSAGRRARKGSVDVKRLLKVFAASTYTEADLETVLDTLDTSVTGASPQSTFCAWMLGLSDLNEQDHARAALSLRAVLLANSKFIIVPRTMRHGRAGRWTFNLSSALIVLPLLIGIAGSQANTALIPACMVTVCAFIFVPIALYCHRLYTCNDAADLRFTAAYSLRRLRAVSAIDTLSAMCLERDYLSAKMATLALRATLPHLTYEDYGRLGSDVSPNLCRLLREHSTALTGARTTDFAFALELLTALEKIGYARAIPVVRQSLRYWTDWNYVRTANRALVVLEERKRQETERGTLLRGAGQPAVSDGELLRAASGKEECKTLELLRPLE